ncbi:MarP family serine protease [Corynebacterium timonense]|uniref:Serine protease n=1 Tax=Corynebacterium timonense TaxID=441500 RepID=A0A1H1TKB3_9CORY|nr:MarP family serine protease [Corynebacterium timonense]SDS60614.1 Colicin V production protein [Corynebacterium timonense]
MTAQIVVDVVIVVIILSAFVSGWRRGASSAVLSVLGIAAGLVIGLALAPYIVRLADTQFLRVLLLIAVIVFFAGLGSAVGGVAGAQVRDRARFKTTQTLDSVVGALFQALAFSLVLWFVSLPLATVLPGPLGAGVRESRVLALIDRVVPPGAENLPARFAALLDDSGLPPLVSPFATTGAPVPAPDPAAVDPAMVERVRPSVIHVIGDAEACGRQLMGSGFVAAPDYVITNAHVVAGTNSVELDTVLGVKEATVVFYDPGADIAVLHSPGLGLDALPIATDELARGEDAVVMGFPRSGPFEAAPARIRGTLTIAGPDIYAIGRVEREAYTLRGSIRQGNSGGPVLTTGGEVAGVVFGASADASETGYALTARQVVDKVGDVRALGMAVDTGMCVTR